MNLVIVESPAKSKTISRYLGPDFQVLSSFGHIRDLPKKNIGIDIARDYQPSYSIPRKSNPALKAIKNTITNKKTPVKKVILATDEDREGEAIAFHLKWIIQKYAPKMKFERITFHEITRSAIKKALQKPRDIDLNLFNAQQARRVLDRLVGYNLSPLLWKKIRYGLSAGRVQSVALRLIVEREKQRQAFREEEYWTIQADLSKSDYQPQTKNPEKLQQDPKVINAELLKINQKKLQKIEIKNKKQAEKITRELEKLKYQVEKLEKNQVKRNPKPPYRTSTLQRDAANKLGFSAKQTMMIAQRLYEGIKLKKGSTGLITYMRTDSLYISSQAQKKARDIIEKKFGPKYTLETPRYFKNNIKGAQEAHEAIRPTFPQKTPESIKQYLDPAQYKLYRMIWQTFVASQMQPAVFDQAKVLINAGQYTFKAQGSLVKFDGYLKVFGPDFKIQESQLPELKEKEILNFIHAGATQHFTQPPARYTDASLIKALEENGIGRPSTYAPTLSTITTRGYVEKDLSKQYIPQEIGFLVNDLMVEHFPKIVNFKFTAQMETDLDSIAQGKKQWVKTIDEFYKPFSKELKIKSQTIEKYQKKTEKNCPECGKSLIEKWGRFGKFFACSGWPECKYTQDPKQKETDQLEKELKMKNNGVLKCEKCGAPMVVKRGKWGPFLGCSKYPDCKNIKPIENSSGVQCPLCKKGEIVEKKSRRGIFWACNNYPKCKNAMNGKPIGEKCPQCQNLLIQIDDKKIKCSNKECDFTKQTE
ncbi:MAG: type I DNA topoisomerase [Patescibacteria group bacterium]|nr:type I DNA topoisomerase [Patescibacteria group bacterium]